MSFTCKSCNAPIIFAVTKNDRRIPLDVEPVAGGNILVTQGLNPSGTPMLFAEVVDPLSQPVTKPLYRAHLPTCSAREHRRTGPSGGVHVP